MRGACDFVLKERNTKVKKRKKKKCFWKSFFFPSIGTTHHLLFSLLIIFFIQEQTWNVLGLLLVNVLLLTQTAESRSKKLQPKIRKTHSALCQEQWSGRVLMRIIVLVEISIWSFGWFRLNCENYVAAPHLWICASVQHLLFNALGCACFFVNICIQIKCINKMSSGEECKSGVCVWGGGANFCLSSPNKTMINIVKSK